MIRGFNYAFVGNSQESKQNELKDAYGGYGMNSEIRLQEKLYGEEDAKKLNIVDVKSRFDNSMKEIPVESYALTLASASSAT